MVGVNFEQDQTFTISIKNTQVGCRMSCSFQTRNTISIIISCGPYHLLLTYLLAHLNQINYTELYIIRKRLITIFLRLIKEKDKRFADFTQHNLIFTDDNLFSSRSDMHLACICLTLTL